jgi:lysylphosphatidylglycerol synthetase-like protein (DUF2156 family)
MRIIPTFVHGIADYILGIVLLLLPNIFGFADLGGPAVWIPRILGVIDLIQSLATDYELGVVKILPMKIHLMNDYVVSLFFAVSPWLFGFSHRSANVWMPSLIIGLVVFVVSLMTRTQPGRRVAGSHA